MGETLVKENVCQETGNGHTCVTHQNQPNEKCGTHWEFGTAANMLQWPQYFYLLFIVCLKNNEIYVSYLNKFYHLHELHEERPNIYNKFFVFWMINSPLF